jgi:hypothetical protein
MLPLCLPGGVPPVRPTDGQERGRTPPQPEARAWLAHKAERKGGLGEAAGQGLFEGEAWEALWLSGGRPTTDERWAGAWHPLLPPQPDGREGEGWGGQRKAQRGRGGGRAWAGGRPV